MIKVNSFLKVADNSGVKVVKCIKILGGYKKKTAKIGDIIIVTVKEIRDKTLKKRIKLQRKDIARALIIRTKFFINIKLGIKLKFKSNNVVLIDKNNNPLGTRIFGFVPKFLKKNYYKITTLSLKKV